MRQGRKSQERRKPPVNLRRARSSLLAEVLGRARNTIGRNREDAVLSALAMNHDGAIPDWIKGFERGTTVEDRRGIDIIVHTDIGKLYLQIKGTRKAVIEFLDAHPKGNIVPFIVERNQTPLVLRGKLIACLKKERERILALRSI